MDFVEDEEDQAEKYLQKMQTIKQEKMHLSSRNHFTMKPYEEEEEDKHSLTEYSSFDSD